MVNRMWAHLFGRGIVESVDNFEHWGTNRPTETLTTCATLIANGWSIKSMIKRSYSAALIS
jgi:hypothetical protein